MKTSVAVMLVVAVLLCFLAGTANAQSNCRSGSALGVVGYYQPPIGVTCEPWGDFVFLLICWGNNTNCAPTKVETFCADCAGKPIMFGNGNTSIEQTDVRIPGLSNGLSLVRTWISRWPSSLSLSQVGLFGLNWRSNYEERVFLGDDGYLRYARGDGSVWAFGLGGPGWSVVAPGNAGATLVQGTSYWTLTLKNGEQRRFDINSGSLTAIIDRNGNTTQLTYDGINRLTTVTDPVSRHLTFTYASPTSFQVTGVSSDVGLSLTYAYETQNPNRLSKVTKPDLSTLTFQYDTNSMITAVLDSDNKVLESHTYDSSQRGKTSSRANGVEAVTITYP